MKTITSGRRPLFLGALALTFAIVAVALAESGVRLAYHGKTVSHDIRMIDGHAYVPLSDMARAVGGRAVKDADGFTIQTDVADPTLPVGGANQVNGKRGTLGQMLNVGKWRFEAIGVDRAGTYESRYLPEVRTFEPVGTNEELVIVRCRIKNAQTVQMAAMLSSVHPHNTALADDQGQSYAPLGFDKHTGSTDESPMMLPGAQTDFAAIFSVPKGTKLKDLVFSLQNAYEDTPDGGTDVRISLGS